MASQGNVQLPNLLSRYPHLREYLTVWQREGRRPPVFAVQLSREMRDMEEVNVLYPIGDPFFVHVYSAEGPWRRYAVIQPKVEEASWKALEYVDEAVAVRLLRGGEPLRGDKEETLMKLLEDAVVPDPQMRRGEYRVVRRGGVVTEIRADPMLAAGIRHYVLMEKTAHGVIEPFIRDPYIEDISCDGVGPVFIVHKVFEGCVTNIEFRDEKELDQFVQRLSIKCGRPASFRNPIIDAQLPDGSRVNIVYGSDVSRRGSNFTIRKFSDTPISITQLIKWNVLSAEAAAYLWMLLESNMNVWFCGETASGKTTLLRAAAVFIRPTAKIVSIEDVPEIVVPHENWVSEVTKKGEAGTSGVELFDLLKAALRQRPNYIIVGEIRGQEASVAFQAMQCVDDAVVFTERGPVRLSQLYSQFRSLEVPNGQGSTYIRFPYQIRVYATTPCSSEILLASAVGLKRSFSNETVRVTLSTGESLCVTPNHRFILAPYCREVEASRLLEMWNSGHRDLKLDLRSPNGGALGHPNSSMVLPVGHGYLWYLVGRLIGGDYLVRRNRKYELVSKVRGQGDAASLESVISSIMTCDGSSSARLRGSRTRLTFRNLRPELVHWLRASGLLVSEGDRLWGGLLTDEVGDRSALVRGILDALEGWGSRFQGGFGVSRASWTIWSLSKLGLSRHFRARVGREALGWRGLDGVLRSSGMAYSISEDRTVELRCDLEVEAELNGEGRSSVMRYWKLPQDSVERFVFESWRDGLNLRTFHEGGTAYCYGSGRYEWVTDVSPNGPSYVYDLVLKGATYYIGGTGPALPIMDTGHGVISTFHAGSVQKLIQRLVSDPINVPKTFIDNLNCVVLQSAVLHPVTRKLERRVISVNEILGVDPETEGMNYVEVFNWNPVYDAHEFRGEGTSYLLEEKIAKMRGIARREIRRIYRELETRARFLRALMERGVFDYREVFRAVSLASSIGVEKALEGEATV